MKTPSKRSTRVPSVQGEDSPSPESSITAEPSIFDGLSHEDRASIERGLAQSRDGLYATDAEVEAAFALFDS